MKLVILVSFLLVLPMFSSGILETLHLDNVNRKVKELVMIGRRIDLEMDYTGPHLRPPGPPKPAGPTNPRTQVDEVVTKEPTEYIIDYGDWSPRPVTPRPRPYVPPPPPPPSRRPPFTTNH